MEQLKIYQDQINEYNINSALFLQYIYSYGFNPDNYDSILELFGTAKQSMSQFLIPHKQYLLSENVDYSELEDLCIDGARGYLFADGLFVPGCKENCERTLHLKTYSYMIYGCPNIDAFDVIIANGTSKYIYNAVRYDQDKYLGFCLDANDENLDIDLKRCENLVKILNESTQNNYILEQDEIATQGKKLCFVRKTN